MTSENSTFISVFNGKAEAPLLIEVRTTCGALPSDSNEVVKKLERPISANPNKSCMPVVITT